MPKFKVGDKVRRINDDHMNMIVGNISTVTKTWGDFVSLAGYGGTHWDRNLELVVEQMEPIGEQANEFMDTNGKKMFMLSLTREQTIALRTLLGHHIPGMDKADKYISGIHQILCKKVPSDGAARVATNDNGWFFEQYTHPEGEEV